jgi:hypothetical protein
VIIPAWGEEQGELMSSTSTGIAKVSNKDIRKCEVCNKIFDSLYILNYHILLEHSKNKRPPIGVG